MKNFIIVILVLLSFISCKEDKDTDKSFSTSTDSKTEQTEIETFYFPDTVTQNTMIKGKLRYNRNFGNVADSKIKERFIFFHVGTDQNEKNTPLGEFDKFPYRLAFEDTIGNGLINFETVFTQPGTNYLHGVVKDMYKIEDTVNSDDSVKISQKETIVTKKVFVLKAE